jgi:hypothetical protein
VGSVKVGRVGGPEVGNYRTRGWAAHPAGVAPGYAAPRTTTTGHGALRTT